MNYKLLLILLILVVFRLVTFKQPYKEGDLIRIHGNVSREVVVYDTQQQINIYGLVGYVDKYPEVKYGDKIVVTGIVKEGKLVDAQVEKIEEQNNLLYKFREKIISFYKSSLPEPHSSLVAGIALGSKSGMPDKFWDTLKNSGTAHVVVASGMNVTLVGGFVLNTLVKFVDRRKAIIGVIVAIWVYAIMAGFDAPIIRAAVMGSIAFTAQALGRLNQALNALFISAGLMLLVDPVWVKDIGFQLSFVATASLIIFGTLVNRLIHFVPEIIKQDLSTSISAQIGVAPLLILYFGSFNLLSPVINALVLWTIPILTIVGMVAGFIGVITPLLGRIILLFIYPLTSWFVTIVNITS